MEVVWTPAAGRNMTGLYRALGPDGGASTLELLALAPTGDGGLELRFRHFGADVQPWGSERDGPLVLRAAPVAPDDPGARRVRFVAVAPGAAVPAIVYDLRAPDRLHVAVTLAGEADPTFTVEFDRVGPPPDAGAAAPAAAAPRR